MQRCSLAKSLVAGIACLLVASAPQAAPSAESLDEGRNFDARSDYNQGFAQPMPAAQAEALASLRARVPEFATTWDSHFGIVTSLTSHTSYLSEPAPAGAAMLDTALRFVNEHRAALGLGAADLSEYRVTDTVFSRVSGATHIYLQQMHRGIPVYQAQLGLHLNRDGRMLGVNNGFVPNIASAVNTQRPTVQVSAALGAVAASVGMRLPGAPRVLFPAVGVQQLTRFAAPSLSTEPMRAELVYLPVRAGEVRLAWSLGTMWTPDGHHSYEFTVDATTGQVWTRSDSTSSATYRVYERPVESPLQTSPLPPTDARTLAVDPENPLASPDGWLKASGALGGDPNGLDDLNVFACTDRNADDRCDTSPVQPTCANGVCDFPIRLDLDPTDPANNADASVANLFYWNNVIHDVQYQYGFDEVGGNFQDVNFGRGGREGDAVFAQGQDGSGQCNANFATPADGANPRMQMFLCNRAVPRRDSDYDAGVITHEYGHGISTRQVGGPSVSCLTGEQQAGEGWSDWFALVYTAKPGDTGPQPRGVGAYLFGLDPSQGQTIRDLPYSTNDAVNTWTYESIRTALVPHGVGSRWSQAIWEVYWALVDKWGFEPDLIHFDPNDPLEAGNKRALFYINEGLKGTRCNPTFLNNRDAIMQVAMDNFGGEDVCTMWRAFAGFGLGTDAASVNSARASARNGFAIPAMCQPGGGGGGGPMPPPSGCNERFRASFETTADGFLNDAARTCDTGDFVRGTPTLVANGGVTTQVAGAAVGTGALFTAVNTAVGVNDVDGGTCDARSPLVRVGAGDVTVSLAYFHGQRDDGGDDGFAVDVLDGSGAVVSTIVSQGGITSNAAWTRASATFNVAGDTDLRLRVRATDGNFTGDLVEGGIDDVQVCANPPAD